jgi:hypothetical protein
MSAMSWMGYALGGAPGAAWRWATSGNSPVDDAKSAWQWGQQRNAPQIGPNPYQEQWAPLLSQLQQQASGEGPSLAGDAFKQANATGMNQQLAMARGGSAGGARQAGMNMAGMNQGLAQGYANARLQEQLAARQMLTQALQGAGNMWFQPQDANLRAQVGTPNNMQQMLSFLMQAGQIGGMAAGGKPPGA